ncbi:23193_t:CDS:2, partial [Racocetra persica]
DRNGIIIEKYIFGNLNKKIGSRKRARDRSEEEIADNVSVISNNDDYLDQDMTSRDSDSLRKGETAYSILKKNPNLFMKVSQLKALKPVNDWISDNILNKQKRKPGCKCSVLVMKNRKGKWSLVESLVNCRIKIAHFRNEFQPHVYNSNECDVLCLDNIYDFTTTNKMNER